MVHGDSDFIPQYLKVTTQKNKHVNRVNQLQGQLKLLNPILQFLPCSRSILPYEPSALKSYPLVNIQKTMENHHV
jgi:hypothetical protein